MVCIEKYLKHVQSSNFFVFFSFQIETVCDHQSDPICEQEIEDMEFDKILSCTMCDKMFNRQSTLTKHMQSVHGPMINCVHPKCNYTAPQSRPQQLQQHMARVHDMHFYKEGSLAGSEVGDDPRMVNIIS